jgi:RNA polymerase sigma-70 factor (ECF subfamily)
MAEDSPYPEELLAFARAGDRDALGRLLEMYRHYLTVLARVEIGRQFQAKLGPSDVVQDAFLKATREFSLFRGKGEQEFMVWLRGILATTLIDRVHRSLLRKKRDVRLEERLCDSLDQSSAQLSRRLVADNTSPSGAAARREEAALFAEALESLSEDYRNVIIWRHLEGLSFAEVAARLGRTVDATQKLWVRALAKLRTVWRHEP